MRVLRSPQQVTIEPNMLACAGEALPTVTERNGKGVVGVPRRDEGGDDKFVKRRSGRFGRFGCSSSSRSRLFGRFSTCRRNGDFDEIVSLYSQGFGLAQTHQARVIPGQLGN